MERTLTPEQPGGGTSVGSPPAGGRIWPPPLARAAEDSWPHTGRLMPWLIAAFLVMLFLVPYDSIKIKANLPVDGSLDRILIVVMVIVWIGTYSAGGVAAPRWRRSALNLAVLAFVGIAALSILVNVSVLHKQEELTGSIKVLSIAMSWLILYLVVATTVRPSELSAFVKLFLALASVCALGTLAEYWSDRNFFLETFDAIVPRSVFDFAPVAPETSQFIRDPVTAHTRHGLAIAGLMAMALSFAVVKLSRAGDLRGRLIYGGVTVLVLLAVFATSRKTGGFASVTALVVLATMEPRRVLRLLPAALVVFTLLLMLRPGTVQPQLQNLDPRSIGDGISAEGRKADYRAVTPDVRERLLLGKGFGSYTAAKYRVVDNHALILLVEVGLLGLGAYYVLLVMVPASARRHVRSRDPVRAPVALAASGAAGALAVSSLLFDALAFTHPVYLFFFSAGMLTVCAEPARRRREEALPPLVERLAEPVAEPLPPLVERVEREPLPPLVADVELERSTRPERERREHDGRRARQGGRFRRRTPRGTPIRDRVSGPLPGRPPADHEPAPPRGFDFGPAYERVRAASHAMRTRNVTRVMLGILTLGLAVGMFGRGGGGDDSGGPTLGQAGAGGSIEDPFASGSGLGQPERDRATARGPRQARDRAPASVVGEVVPVSGPPASGPPAPQRERSGDRDRSRDETPTRGRRKRRRRPQRPPVAPPPSAQPAGPDLSPAPDCLPGEAETLLRGIDVEPCNEAAEPTFGQDDLYAAFRSGRLSAAEVNYLLGALEAARRS